MNIKNSIKKSLPKDFLQVNDVKHGAYILLVIAYVILFFFPKVGVFIVGIALLILTSVKHDEANRLRLIREGLSTNFAFRMLAQNPVYLPGHRATLYSTLCVNLDSIIKTKYIWARIWIILFFILACFNVFIIDLLFDVSTWLRWVLFILTAIFYTPILNTPDSKDIIIAKKFSDGFTSSFLDGILNDIADNTF